MKKYDLEERLIDFSVLIIDLTNSLKNTNAGNHLSKQIIRSGSSVSLNYAEAQSAESRKDFIHKMKVVLKELRETIVCLKIIRKANLSNSGQSVEKAVNECHELISIFVKSVVTAQKKVNRIG